MTCLPIPGRNLGAKQCPAVGGTVISNPVNASSGNKYQQETDYQPSDAFPLNFRRYYNSGGFGSGTVGTRWMHSFERNIAQQDPATAIMTRDDGEMIYLAQCATGWCGGLDLKGTLTQATNTSGATIGWSFVDENDVTEVYDGSGRLLSETIPNGRQHTLSYDAAGRLSKVTDSFGHQIGIQYDTSNRVSQLTLPDGSLIAYAYDSSGNLSSVTYPDTTARIYLYDESSLVTSGTAANSLTGIIDESATRFASFQYNAQSQAILSEHAGGADATQFTYNEDGSTTVLDAAGATRNYTFQTVENVNHTAAISGPTCANCALSASFTYDSNGNITTKTDFDGNQTTYQYDTTRNLETSRTEAAGTFRARTITTTWNSTFRRPTLVTELNRTTGYTYDTSGNVLTKTISDTSVTPNVARTWTYTYDSYGRVLTADGPRNDVADVTTYAYYTCTMGYQCGQLQTVTNAAGQVTTYNTYNAHGQPLTITDPNGVMTTLTYDARQRLKSRQVGSETTAFDYWPTGLLKKVTLPDGSYLAYTYDGAQRLTQVTDALGNKIVYTLDAMGNRTGENSYDPSSALHRTHTRVFNALSQLFQDVNAAGTAAVTATFGYDNNGNQTSIAAPLARSTANAYDELNRLKQITDPASGITQFGYDANDNLTSVTDPRSLVTAYTYNGFGDLGTQTSPDTGTTNNTYDFAGNLATSTDARGAVSIYTYDALNRVTSIAYSLSGTTDQAIAFTYDAGTNGKGHLTGTSDANHSMTWGYDALGRVTSKSQTVSSITQSVGYTYTNGDLSTLTTPSGQTVAYGYNGNHQVTSVAVNGTTVLNSVSYEPLGPVNGWTWGNGTATSRTYDTDGKIASIVSAGTKTYSYDNAFRITGITDTSTGAANWTYGYDTLDRVTSGTSSSITRGWTYDANGNRQTETGTAASTYTTDPSSNRITGITGALARTYSYDAAGNTTGYSTVTATYNNAGRLRNLANGSTTETEIYNALGQRIQVTGGFAGTVLYAYDEGGHLLGEYDATGTLIEETVWLGDIPIATLRPSGSTVAVYYVHSDQLNAPRQVTRDNTPMWTWFSDPFGTDAANTNPAGAGTFAYNLRFPGQIFDGQAGLHQNWMRDYDPATGRYAQSDPVGLNGGINTYAYVQDDPTESSDPRGLLKRGSGWSNPQWAGIKQAESTIRQELSKSCSCHATSSANGCIPCDWVGNLLGQLDRSVVSEAPLGDDCGVGAIPGNQIYLSPVAFTKRCNCLASTLYHELLHNTGLDHDNVTPGPEPGVDTMERRCMGHLCRKSSP
jgi:RHS repeat-associated protein